MTDALHVREATAADRERIAGIHETAMRDAGAYIPEAPTDGIDALPDSYAGGAFLVGEVADAVVATGGVRPTDRSGAAELKRLAVHPDHQRCGYATRLLDELERRARESGFDRLVLDTSPEQRAALALYDERGYGEVERGDVAGYPYVRLARSL